ncbi:MAG TPA: hypothetical protein VGV10_01770 [Thermoleophilaceae bacterium]|nr:hypothetical protein [Thermoleophilaceae bacterium]
MRGRCALPRAAAVLAAVVVALAAAGCAGGDDGDTRGQRTAGTPPERGAGVSGTYADRGAAAATDTPAERKAVRQAVIRLFRTNDPRVICERSLTPRLFRLIFAGPAACRRATSDEEGEEPPERVEVSDVEITGRGATAHTRLIGGDTAGAEGVLSLKKDEKGWRADDFSAAFLRSSVSASLENERKIPAGVSRCIDRRLTAMPDERFKRLALALIGQRREANARLLRLLSECERRRGGVPSVRRELEKSVGKTLRRAGAGRSTIACSLRRLRMTLPDRLLIELAAEKGRRSRARITREVVAAALACGARRPGGPGELSPA